MDLPALTQLAITVAREVRRQIPRSSNRGLEGQQGETTWLKSGLPEYVDLLHTLGRTANKAPSGGYTHPLSRLGSPLEDMKHHPKKLLGVSSQGQDVSVAELKRAVLDFVERNHIDLDYKLGQAAEKAYSEKFARRLADYLNAKGYRHNGKKYTPERVIHQVKGQVTAHQRLFKYDVNHGHHSTPSRQEFATVRFPLPLIVANARNALKFKVGNCEEVGSAAFCMLLQVQRCEGRAIADHADLRCQVELVYAKASAGDAHFFVLLNRPQTDFIPGNTAWLDSPNTLVCDPWFTDEGMGGVLNGEDPALQELRQWLQGSDSEPTHIAVRASAVLGSGLLGHKSSDLFSLT